MNVKLIYLSFLKKNIYLSVMIFVVRQKSGLHYHK